MELTLRPQNRTLRLLPGRPVLEAALAAHINLPHSCKGGSCGSCRARLLAGTIDYPRGPPLGLSAAEADAGYVLLCQAVPQSDLVVEAREVRRVTDVEIKTLPCRVERLEPLAPDVMGVFLRLPFIEDFRFQAGQYLDVMLPGGERRSFSIASPPHDAGLLELHVRRVGGGAFTPQVFATLAAGALLRIEGPLGQFVYREPEAGEAVGPLVLVAGGTGFAPLKAILRQLLESRARRPLHLYWGARQAVDLYQDAWVRERCARFAELQYVPVLSRPAAGEAERFRTGLVHEAVLADFADLSAAEVYAAGPPALIAALQATLPDHGLAPGRLYFDSFDYAPRAAPLR
jgi:CDP-4-dehydro-6-deoxyglucose reductase